MICLNSDQKNAPSIYIPMALFCFYPVWKASRIYCKQCFFALETSVVYSTNDVLSAINKNVLPALQKSNVIYQLSCRWDCQYVCHAIQRQQDRIKQHVPKSIRSFSSSQKRLLLAGWFKSFTHTNNLSLASSFTKSRLCSALWWQWIVYSCPTPLSLPSI